MFMYNDTLIAGNICKKPLKQKTSYKPSFESANCICQGLGFHNVAKVGNLASNRNNFAEEYDAVIGDLEVSCPSNLAPNITHIPVESCTSSYYFTFVSCTCRADHYVTARGCATCPGTSTSSGNDSRCDCPVGSVWEEEGQCRMCPENTYSVQGRCVECTSGSWAPEGSLECLCAPGFYRADDGCVRCGQGQYSYSNDTKCAECPDLTTPPKQDSCHCQAGSLWNTTGRECRKCPVNYFSLGNTSSCTKCPEGSASHDPPSQSCICPPGYIWQSFTWHDATAIWAPTTCQICPENHYSGRGARECTKCPPFHTAAPGSEYCTQCTLGEQALNHSCQPCPAQLFGDGARCWPCPAGLVAVQGFCVDEGVGVSNIILYISAGLVASLFLVTWALIWRCAKTCNLERREQQEVLQTIDCGYQKDLDIMEEESKAGLMTQDQTPWFL